MEAVAGPLSGTVVLDLSSVGPASRCTRLLADYGASVVKVAPVPADGAPMATPAFHVYGAQRGTRRVCVDLKDPDGRAAFFALAERADVVVESFRPGVMDRLGVGYAELSRRNPGLVYCATTGYGTSGPRATWAGHDLNYLAMGGYLASSEPRGDGGPPLPGATIADAAAGGMQAALAITTALLRRHASGRGCRLDVSVTDGVRWLMALAIDEHLATGSAPGPGHDVLSGRYACYGTYRTRDGRWLAVGAIEERFFANLCRALGCEGLAARQYDDSAQDEVRAELASRFAERDRDDWAARLAGTDTCVAPVLTVAEVADDPDLAERGGVVEVVHPVHGSFRQLGPVLAGTGSLPAGAAVPDATLTDTRALLEEAGVPPEDVAAWLKRGAVK